MARCAPAPIGLPYGTFDMEQRATHALRAAGGPRAVIDAFRTEYREAGWHNRPFVVMRYLTVTVWFERWAVRRKADDLERFAISRLKYAGVLR